MMMTRSFCLDWITALQSGLYKQCRGGLIYHGQTELSYCCIGVAGDLCNKGGLPPFRQSTSATACEAGLQDHEVRELVQLNDTDKRDFNCIARWITQHILPRCV